MSMAMQLREMRDKAWAENQLLYVDTDIGKGILEKIDRGVLHLLVADEQTFEWKDGKPVFNHREGRPISYFLVDLERYTGSVITTKSS